MNDTVAVGSFFKCSWGYDQTNVDFYRVVGISPSGKTIRVQLWSAKAGGTDGVVPGDKPMSYPKWVDREMVGEVDAAVLTKRLSSWSDRPTFTVNSHSAAYLWDGHAAYQTPVGAGH